MMATYISAQIVCDRCRKLIAMVELKYFHVIQPLEKEDFPEGVVFDPIDNKTYCHSCVEKYGDQLNLKPEEEKDENAA